MKKIVSVVAAAAVLASSVFAADVSAKVRLEGSLLDVDKDGNVSALKIEHAAGQNWNPVLSLSVSEDNAGASVSFFSGAWAKCNAYELNGSKKDDYIADAKAGGMSKEDAEKEWNKASFGDDFYSLGASKFNIWFKPFDALKVSLGDISMNLNQEQIDWCNTKSGCDSKGYGLTLTAGDIAIDAAFIPGWGNFWFAGKKAGETYAKFQFNGGDIGTINAMLDGKENFKDLTFGLGYNKSFGDIMIFENVLGFYKDEFNKVRSETFAKGTAGDFGWNVWVPVDFEPNKDKDKATVGSIVKCTYPIGSASVYIYLKDENFLAKDFAMTIKPGVTGKVGNMGYEVAFQVSAAKKTTFAVPVNFTVDF